MMIKKLRNKGTGEIGYLYANKDVNYQVLGEDDCVLGVYDTLPRLIEEWEDYKLNIWYNSTISGRYTIEIDFATDKEAKKAMDKLKAWMRLKDKGFRFEGWEDLQAEMGIDDLMLFNRDVINTDNVIGFRMDDYHDCIKDLNTCFGGGE